MNDVRRWLWAVVLSGAVMFVLSGVLQETFPQAMGPLPQGLRTPVLALELARGADEIETMFGARGSEQRAQWVPLVDRGNLIDFAFIAVYGGFLLACARAFAARRPAQARIARRLALVAAAADALENAALFAITARLGGDYGVALAVLIAATWLKWLSLAGCLATLSPVIWDRGGWGYVAGWLAAATLPLALVAAAVRWVVAELMLSVIVLAFVALWIEGLRALTSRRAGARTRPS